MTQLKFYNSFTKQLEPFLPIEPGKIRLYHCGPTVYKRQHLGNMRRFLFADILRRTLEYFGYEVREITNITDVGHLTQDEIDSGEDKLEKEASQQKTTPQQIADLETKQFLTDLNSLNIQPSHKYPRATGHIKEMQALIQRLIANHHAYVTKTGVYYEVSTFPPYGQLSGNTTGQLVAGKRVAIVSDKRHPADFLLWKTNDPSHLQQWDSPWGRGYPGWHIECSAMSQAYLGTELDIHTGGEDNKFPHHENEIAQSEGATQKKFVRFWLHNAHLKMSGQKLAKRSGAQLTLSTLAEHNYSPLAFRLLVFGAHYRTPLEFSWEAMDSAQKQLAILKQFLRRILASYPPDKGGEGGFNQAIIGQFQSALADDLNTPAALSVFWQLIREINKLIDTGSLSPKEAQVYWSTMRSMDKVLGLLEPLRSEIATETIPEEVKGLVEQREKARANGDFKLADSLRQQIQEKGYSIEDTLQDSRIVKTVSSTSDVLSSTTSDVSLGK